MSKTSITILTILAVPTALLLLWFGIMFWIGFFGGSASAHATTGDYFYFLGANNVVVWDYPLMQAHGTIVCGLLYDDINPMGWLYSVGYDTPTATGIIISAQQGLCPGNAVTGPPQLLEAI